MSEARRHVGIEPRHRAGCSAHDGGKCGCKPAYRAEVYSRSEGKRIRKTFPTYSAAKSWRDDHLGTEKRSRLRADPGPTLREAATSWLKGAQSGANLTRSGDAYKPSALRGYDQALKLRVLPELGGKRLREINRADLQRFIAKISAGSNGKKPEASTIRNTLLPVRAIYRDALALGEAEHNPTTGLRLPAARGKRERIASRTEAGALIEAAPESERAIWATALYAGLRLGELRALRWRDVDFEGGIVHVRRSWDAREGPITPKSEAGKRKVPMPQALRAHLQGHHRTHSPATGPDALVFGRSATKAFHPDTPTQRARRKWKAAKLEPLTLHDCRHTYASLMIDAGANAKALSTYMGHANIAITMDRYGHLMEGNEVEAAKRFDAYLRNGAEMGAGITGFQRSPASSGAE